MDQKTGEITVRIRVKGTWLIRWTKRAARVAKFMRIRATDAQVDRIARWVANRMKVEILPPSAD